MLMQFVCISGASELPTNNNIGGVSGPMALASPLGCLSSKLWVPASPPPPMGPTSWDLAVYRPTWVGSKVFENCMAYRQGTSKREGAQAVNKSVSHKVMHEAPTPV